MRRDPQLLEQALDLLRITGRLREDVAKDIQNWAGIVSDRPRVRLKEVTRRLRKIERTAAQLAQLLSAHDADVGDAFGPLVPLERCFSFLEKKDETFLMGLSQKSRHLREDIVKDCGCGELRVRTRVTDKQSFVMQLVEIWARCRGHIGLSSYEGGPLFMFILKCWQWATGEEDISGLRHYLQQEIPSRRELLKQSAAERKAILARRAGRKLLSIGQTPPRKKVRSSA